VLQHSINYEIEFAVLEFHNSQNNKTAISFLGFGGSEFEDCSFNVVQNDDVVISIS